MSSSLLSNYSNGNICLMMECINFSINWIILKLCVFFTLILYIIYLIFLPLCFHSRLKLNFCEFSFSWQFPPNSTLFLSSLLYIYSTTDYKLRIRHVIRWSVNWSVYFGELFVSFVTMLTIKYLSLFHTLLFKSTHNAIYC